MLGEKTRFDELALDVVAGSTTDTSEGGGVVGGTNGQEHEQGAPAHVEKRKEVRGKDSLRETSTTRYDDGQRARITHKDNDASVVIPLTIVLLCDEAGKYVLVDFILFCRRVIVNAANSSPADAIPFRDRSG